MSIGVSEMYADHERSFRQLQEQVTDRINSVGRSSGSNARAIVKEAESMCSEAEQELRQMEMELRSVSPEVKAQYKPQLDQYRSNIQSQKKELEGVLHSVERSHLLGGDGLGKSLEDRHRVAGATDELQRGQKQLEDAKRLALETEDIGLDVMSDLRQQREVILRSRQNMGVVDTELGSAGRILKSMGQRAMANKMLVYVVVAVMLIALIVFLYFFLKG